MAMSFRGVIVAALCASRLARATECARSGHDGQPTSFQTFGQTVGLSPSDIGSLGKKCAEARTDTDTLQAACLTAQATIGQQQVDTLPLNQTVVEENCPENATDVSKALQIIRYFNATFAVRSGGNSPNPGASSVGGHGILLDLQRLDGVRLSSDGATAHVGAGARWGDVYDALNGTGAAVMGGRLPGVGVGGLLLGGGLFHFAAQYGLAADHVAAAEVVLANGSVVTARADAHRALWWALRGGGPNYGVVTRYDLATVPVAGVWGLVLALPPDRWEAAYAAFHTWQRVGARDVRSSAAISASLSAVTVSLIYSEPAVAPEAFAPFFELGAEPVVGPLNTTLAATAQLLGAAAATSAKRHDYRGCSSLVDANLTSSVYAFWRKRAQEVHEATGANQTFTIQHIGASLVEYGNRKGGNPLGLPKGIDMQWWTTLIDWNDAASDDAVRAVSAETTALWAELGAARGSALGFVYLNDASRDQNPLASYGQENLAKLREVSRAYDPDQVFQKLQNGGFLLSRA